MKYLESGNARFLSGQFSKKDLLGEVKNLQNGQSPYAVILACSDSRVPPELVFDESLGKLFIVRLAGNVATPEAIGSIEYAVEHLHSQLIVVLGHSKCGAVTAAVNGGHTTPNIEKLIHYIEPAVNEAKSMGDIADMVQLCVDLNVKHQIKHLTEKSPLLEEKVASGALLIVGGVYDLATGQMKSVQ
ncbi:MAG: carbonic anhydrase [Ignavibacteriales bacterium]|nr:carbonic anhydrase [Ignavibacteriales bacterium]